MWVSVREDETGPADRVGVFMSGARVGSNKSPTPEGSCPFGILEKGDEVANLVDSSLMGKRIERPLLSRENTGRSLAKNLGVLVLAFQHPKLTATSWSERGDSDHVRLEG